MIKRIANCNVRSMIFVKTDLTNLNQEDCLRKVCSTRVLFLAGNVPAGILLQMKLTALPEDAGEIALPYVRDFKLVSRPHVP